RDWPAPARRRPVGWARSSTQHSSPWRNPSRLLAPRAARSRGAIQVESCDVGGLMYQRDLLLGRNILVTGGGTGLGKAMALRYAELGARVAVLGRREPPLEQVVGETTTAGGRAAWASADGRDRASVDAALDRLEAELGPLTDAVNNAAGHFLCAREDLSPGGFDAVVKIVLYGTFHVTQALGQRWIERGPERSAGKLPGYTVLSILTTYAWMGSPFVLPSACAKAGVLALTRSLATEWACYGIRL